MPSLLLASVFFSNSTPLDPERLNPQPIASFDGNVWAGLTLNGITDREIKKKYRTEKGAVRPEALKITTTSDSGVRVDALLDGRGDKAVMQAIRIGYDRSVDIEKLGDELHEKPVRLFTRERHEDWWIEAFVDHGIIALVIEGQCDTFYLTSPDRTGMALRDFGDRQTLVTEPPDPGANWDRVLRFGYTSASVTVGSSKPDELDADGRRRIGNRLKNLAESLREPSLRYSSGSSDRLSISVSSDKFDKDGEANFTVSVGISANTPYGQFDETASRSRKIGSNYDRRLSDLLEDAFYELARDVRNKIQRLGPPPRDASRKRFMDRLMDAATRKPN
ncbi:MAG: hypothetical protein IT203_09175 [Fimbriimonadaceae bacterium]|nr:hypothetical protein [Fimbriimonadaceae bacterium]